MTEQKGTVERATSTEIEAARAKWADEDEGLEFDDDAMCSRVAGDDAQPGFVWVQGWALVHPEDVERVTAQRQTCSCGSADCAVCQGEDGSRADQEEASADA